MIITLHNNKLLKHKKHTDTQNKVE